MSELVLNFDDAVLTAADVRLLRDARAWLNDACIGFAFKWFARAPPPPPPGAAAPPPPGGVALVDPAVVACARLSCSEPEEFADLARGLGLRGAALLLVPVNDNDGFFDGGGAHWSLLAVARDAARDDGDGARAAPAALRFVHYDSAGEHNAAAAARTAAVFAALEAEAAAEAAGAPAERAAAPVQRITVERARAPQQVNGHDCGVYAIATARELAARFRAARGASNGAAAAARAAIAPDVDEPTAASLEGALTPARVVATRQEVYAAVQSAIAAAAASGD